MIAGVQLPSMWDGRTGDYRRDPMPIYISRGKFTSDAVGGMLAKPENREEAVASLFKSVGGKLIGWYLTFGHTDCLLSASSLITKQWPLRCSLWRAAAVCPT
jgi:GYD domain